MPSYALSSLLHYFPGSTDQDKKEHLIQDWKELPNAIEAKKHLDGLIATKRAELEKQGFRVKVIYNDIKVIS